MYGFPILCIIIIYKTFDEICNPGKKTKNKWKKKILKQKESEGFKRTYEYVKNNYTYELEVLRKTLIKKIIYGGILILISIIITIIIADKIGSFKLVAYVFAIISLYTTTICIKYNKKYQAKYKKYVIENFITTINPLLTYTNTTNNKLEKYYNDAQFKNISFNQFKSEDYIYGYIYDKLFEMSDVILQKQTTSENKETVYNCVFASSQLIKTIPEEIRLKNNKKYFKVKNNKVELDSTEFEKYFDVFSNSRILAMEILTHDIMEDLVQFYNGNEINFEIVIRENRIYIRYEIGDIFEGKIFSKSTNKKALLICYNTLNFAINLTLKINKILEEKEL